MRLVDTIKANMAMSDEARFRLILVCGLALVLFIGGWVVLTLRDFDSASLGQPSPRREKAYRTTLAENLRVMRSGMSGVDFVKCGTCRLEKRKRGPITFGALNMLVLEDLSVVLPPDGAADDGGDGDGALGVVRHLGVNDGFLSSRGIPYKFSGVRVVRLAVSRLVREKDVRPVFRAEKAEAVRGGLELSKCEVVTASGELGAVGKALLTKKGRRLHLVWRGGEMEI